MNVQGAVAEWENHLTKKKSVGFSLFAVLLWWMVLYSFSFVITSLLPQGYLADTYMMYFYVSVLCFFLLWYLACVPKILRIKPKAYFAYLKFLKILGSRKGYLYALLFLVLSVVQYALLPASLQSSASELIWSLQPAIVEEIIFRGFILGILLKNFSKPFSVTLSLVLFVSIHFLNGPMGMLSATIFGLVLTGIRLHTHSILPGIIVHYFINEQILVLGIPMAVYCIFIIITFMRRRIVQS